MFSLEGIDIYIKKIINKKIIKKIINGLSFTSVLDYQSETF